MCKASITPRLPVFVRQEKSLNATHAPTVGRGATRCETSMIPNDFRTKKDVVRRCGSCTELSVNKCLRELNDCLTPLPVKAFIADNFAQKTRTTDTYNIGCERVAKCACQKAASFTSTSDGAHTSIGTLNRFNGRLIGRPSAKRQVCQHLPGCAAPRPR